MRSHHSSGSAIGLSMIALLLLAPVLALTAAGERPPARAGNGLVLIHALSVH